MAQRNRVYMKKTFKENTDEKTTWKNVVSEVRGKEKESKEI